MTENKQEEPFTVLLADDQKFMLKFLKRDLEEIFEVKMATSLEEAKELLKKEKIHVVVSDHQMSNNEGVEILEYIRDNLSHIRRIIISGDRHEDIAMEMLKNKLVHSVAYKPTVNEKIQRLIEEQVKFLQQNNHH